MNKTLGIPSQPDKPSREAMMDCLKSKALAKRLEKRTGCVLGIEPNSFLVFPGELMYFKRRCRIAKPTKPDKCSDLISLVFHRVLLANGLRHQAASSGSFPFPHGWEG